MPSLTPAGILTLSTARLRLRPEPSQLRQGLLMTWPTSAAIAGKSAPAPSSPEKFAAPGAPRRCHCRCRRSMGRVPLASRQPHRKCRSFPNAGTRFLSRRQKLPRQSQSSHRRGDRAQRLDHAFAQRDCSPPKALLKISKMSSKPPKPPAPPGKPPARAVDASMPKAVIARPLILIGEHFIGFVDLFEFRLRRRFPGSHPGGTALPGA